MTEDYIALSKRASQGDLEATRELFRLGCKAQDTGEFQGAAAYFRDAAISYRIAACRADARASEAEAKVRPKGSPSRKHPPGFPAGTPIDEQIRVVQGVSRQVVARDADPKWGVRYHRYVVPEFVLELCTRYLDAMNSKAASDPMS